MTAPRMATTVVPRKWVVVLPRMKRLTTNPPISAPISPTTISPRQPKPFPRVIRPAIAPAMSPTRIQAMTLPGWSDTESRTIARLFCDQNAEAVHLAMGVDALEVVDQLAAFQPANAAVDHFGPAVRTGGGEVGRVLRSVYDLPFDLQTARERVIEVP